MGLRKIPKEHLELAEKFARDFLYPDSSAKGIMDTNGFYFEEVEITMKIFLEGFYTHQKEQRG